MIYLYVLYIPKKIKNKRNVKCEKPLSCRFCETIGSEKSMHFKRAEV